MSDKLIWAIPVHQSVLKDLEKCKPSDRIICLICLGNEHMLRKIVNTAIGVGTLLATGADVRKLNNSERRDSGCLDTSYCNASNNSSRFDSAIQKVHEGSIFLFNGRFNPFQLEIQLLASYRDSGVHDFLSNSDVTLVLEVPDRNILKPLKKLPKILISSQSVPPVEFEADQLSGYGIRNECALFSEQQHRRLSYEGRKRKKESEKLLVKQPEQNKCMISSTSEGDAEPKVMETVLLISKRAEDTKTTEDSSQMFETDLELSNEPKEETANELYLASKFESSQICNVVALKPALEIATVFKFDFPQKVSDQVNFDKAVSSDVNRNSPAREDTKQNLMASSNEEKSIGYLGDTESELDSAGDNDFEDALEEPTTPALEELAQPAVEELAPPAVEELIAPAAERLVAPAAERLVAPAAVVEERVAPAAEEERVAVGQLWWLDCLVVAYVLGYVLFTSSRGMPLIRLPELMILWPSQWFPIV